MVINWLRLDEEFFNTIKNKKYNIDMINLFDKYLINIDININFIDNLEYKKLLEIIINFLSIKEDLIITQDIANILIYYNFNKIFFINRNLNILYNQKISKYFKNIKNNIGFCSLLDALFYLKKSLDLTFFYNIDAWINNINYKVNLTNLLDCFLKNSKDYVIEDFKLVINNTNIFEYFFNIIFKFNLLDLNILEKIIYLGAYIDINILNKNFVDYNKAIVENNKHKINCYILIKKAYYGRKIFDYIKNALDDEFILTKLRYNIDKKRYINLIKNK